MTPFLIYQLEIENLEETWKNKVLKYYNLLELLSIAYCGRRKVISYNKCNVLFQTVQ